MPWWGEPRAERGALSGEQRGPDSGPGATGRVRGYQSDGWGWFDRDPHRGVPPEKTY